MSFNKEEYLESLANSLLGERNDKNIREYFDEAEDKLDIDRDDIMEILASDYDCIRCLECVEFYHLQEFVITTEDGEMCQDCADHQELEYE